MVLENNVVWKNKDITNGKKFCVNIIEGEKMDLQNIQDQLNTEISKLDTRIIFWFDDKGA